MKVITTNGSELTRNIRQILEGVHIKSLTLYPEDIKRLSCLRPSEQGSIITHWVTRVSPPPAVPVKAKPLKQPDLELLEEFTEPFIPKGFTLIGYRVPSHGELVAMQNRGMEWAVTTAPPTTSKCLIVERDRWRGEIGEEYEYVAPTGVVSRREDLNEPKDEQLWESGNYYRVGEAQAVADQIAEVHKNAKRG